MSSPYPFNDITDRLTAAGLGYPISLPNEHFERPDGLWIRVDATSHSLAPIELGGGGWAEQGTAYFEVFAPQNTGTAAARTLAKNICDVFRHATNGYVVYLSTAIGTGAPEQPDGMWWVLTVSVDFRYQDTNT